MKKLTFVELMYAALVWGMKRSEKVGMDLSHMRGYMGHLAYLCMHATTANYTDEAYRGYDKAVCEKVKEKGLRHFRLGDQELSLLHFNLDNAKALKDSKKLTVRQGSSSKRGTESASKVRGACYGFNYNKEGCVAKDCKWEHRCLACKGKDHLIEACTNKRY